MATSLKLKAILSSLTITLIIFLCHTQVAFSFGFEDGDQEDEVYVLDNPGPSLSKRSKFLVSVIRKGEHCNPDNNNICNGVSANHGTSLLYCCKKHCRNIYTDKNNCGECGNKCKFGELCCNGSCTSVGFNDNHCGKCNKKCPYGIKCEYGSCGYA